MGILRFALGFVTTVVIGPARLRVLDTNYYSDHSEFTSITCMHRFKWIAKKGCRA